MARSHFRSQPSLQRTGHHAGGTWWLLLLAASSIAVGVYSVGTKDLPPSLQPETARPEPAARRLAERPAAAAPAATETIAPAVDPVPDAAPPKAPPQAAAVTPPGPAPRAPRPLTPMERYARGEDHFEEEMRAYTAGERQAGYRWASRNRVSARLYCAAVRKQRTAPFALGCLDYLRERGSG